MQRLRIVLGLCALVLGLLWPWLGKLPLGRLPGDIVIERDSCRLHLPLTSMLLVSLFVSLLLWLLRR